MWVTGQLSLGLGQGVNQQPALTCQHALMVALYKGVKALKGEVKNESGQALEINLRQSVRFWACGISL